MNDNFRCRSSLPGYCVLFGGAELATTDCDLTVCTGEEYDTIIEDFYEKICELLSNDCLVQTSATDDCCDYLQAKITAADQTITIEKLTDGDTGCEVLDLSVTPEVLDWTSLTPEGVFSVTVGLQYSKDSLGNVYLRGEISGDPSMGNNTVAILPSGFRPTVFYHQFPAILALVSDNTIHVGMITINTSGTVVFYCDTNLAAGLIPLNYTFNIN